MTTWVKIRREGGEAAEATSFVTIRRGGIAFNATFVRIADIEKMTRVVILVDKDSLRVGFKFLESGKDEDSYALTRDGGGRGVGRWAQAGALLREPWIGAIARMEDARHQRFKPVWSSPDAMWVISLRPSFEVRVSAGSEIPSGLGGIYRYRRGDEVVYIGRGLILSRFNAPERKEWDFEVIEYSPVPAEQDQERWEAYWFDSFMQEHNKLPIYNRIGGSKKYRALGGQSIPGSS